MRDEDLEMFRKWWPRWKTDDLKTAYLIHASPEEGQLAESLGLECDVEESPKRTVDVIIASNVLMYVDDPESWIRNNLARCKWLWLQDGVEGVRGNNGNYLGEDGDRHRFHCSPHWRSGWDGAFDLAAVLGFRLSEYEVYEMASPGRHFVALVQGDLQEKKDEQVKTKAKKKKVVPNDAEEG
jgi:hypothetical protein